MYVYMYTYIHGHIGYQAIRIITLFLSTVNDYRKKYQSQSELSNDRISVFWKLPEAR